MILCRLTILKATAMLHQSNDIETNTKISDIRKGLKKWAVCFLKMITWPFSQRSSLAVRDVRGKAYFASGSRSRLDKNRTSTFRGIWEVTDKNSWIFKRYQRDTADSFSCNTVFMHELSDCFTSASTFCITHHKCFSGYKIQLFPLTMV